MSVSLRAGNSASDPLEEFDRVGATLDGLPGEVPNRDRPVADPVRRRDRYFGDGYMWWVWDGPRAVGPFEGAYTARGAWGQWITVFPALDVVIARHPVTEGAFDQTFILQPA